MKQILHVSPPTLSLIARQGQKVDGEVAITTTLDKPLVLQTDAFSLTEKMNYTLVEADKGRKFIVRFWSKDPLSEALNGYLKLHTNYPEKPEITIYIQCGFVYQNS